MTITNLRDGPLHCLLSSTPMGAAGSSIEGFRIEEWRGQRRSEVSREIRGAGKDRMFLSFSLASVAVT